MSTGGSLSSNYGSQQQLLGAGGSGPSPLVRQLSEKVRSQAERLQVLDAYKMLCERRIMDFDPKHPIPVMPYHLGQKLCDQMDTIDSTSAELKKQLAIKDQEVFYLRKENEKLVREN